MNVTLQAAVHLGRDFFGEFTVYPESTPEVWIEDQKEIKKNNLITIDYKELTRRSKSCYVTTLLRLRMPKPTYVFADSVLCLRSM